MPVAKQLLLQGQQLKADFSPYPRALSDGGEIASQVRLAQLTLLKRQVVVGGEAIAHHTAAKRSAQQLDRRCR